MRVVLRTVLVGWVLFAGALLDDTRAQGFVDFHARPGPDAVGHAFIVHGHLDGRGGIASAQVTGFYTNEQYYFKGLLFPLPGFVGGEKEDIAFKSTVIYRRVLTEGQLRELRLGIARFKAMQHSWHLLFFNCNDFLGEMAELIGLHRPPSILLPVSYVAALGAMNRLERRR
jgi:hypothetical protein